MQPDLNRLKIGEEELERLSGLEINDVFMDDVCRPSIVHSSKKLFSFFLTQFFWFGLVCIFVLPTGFIIAQNFINLSKNIFTILKITLVISVIIVLAWNFYTWVKGKQITSLANLLDEVDKYNETVEAVDVLNRLTAVGSTDVNLVEREKVIEVLSVTRDSLVSALMVERILRQHKGLISRRHQLLTHIENNLSTLTGLEVNRQASEYGQLVNDALSIGISVQQEMQNLQS